MMENRRENNFDLYKKSSISGIKWTGMGELLNRGLQFLVTIVLARLLAPADFGIITLTLVVVKFIQVFIDFGIAPALIQKKEIRNEEFEFAFTVLTSLSVILFLLLFFFSGFFAGLIGNAAVGQVLKYLAFVIPISAVNVLPYVVLNRNLEFKKIALSELSGAVGYGIITVSLAFIYRNVWCFVFGIIGEQLISGGLLWFNSKYKPGFRLKLTDYGWLIQFGSTVFFTRFLNFFNLNMLFIFINKFFGSTTLGYFSLAYQIIELPTQRIAKNIMKVMYPVLSRLQDSPAEYKSFLLRTMSLFSLVVFPIFTMLFILAKPFVFIFYGEKWGEAVQFIQILCILGLIRSLWTSISMVSMSIGKPVFEMYLNFSVAVFLLAGIPVVRSYGINIFAGYFVLLILLSFISGQLRISGWLQITFNEIVRFARVPMSATIMLILGVLFVRYLNTMIFTNLLIWNFVFTAVIAVFLYIGFLFFLDREGLKGLFSVILKS